jgi:DNA modification methylase
MTETKPRVTVRIGDALEVLEEYYAAGNRYDCIITDPPYEISTYYKEWDNTGVSFDPKLWKLFYDLLRPGAFVVCFGAKKLYHRLGVAANDAGFTLYPFLEWDYGNSGMPKPQNVSTLFDRDNVPDRQPIGYERMSGHAAALVRYGVQEYNNGLMKPVYEKYVSEEAQTWKGYYYGANCFKPCGEPILLGQKPIETKRMIDNIRIHGTGALYLCDPEQDRWPNTKLSFPKVRRSEHGSDHPTVKPLALMEYLVRMACPRASTRKVLDPFAGTGTTGVAALSLGMNCDLIERDPAMEPVITRRLTQLVEQKTDTME